MKSPLDTLRAILPPPTKPILVNGDWAEIEFAMQTPFPEDYKAFIATYGSGRIFDAGFSAEREVGTLCDPSVLNPFDSLVGHDFFRQIGRTIRSVGIGHKNNPEFDPYPPWPHNGGLLCWCTTGNGDRFYWRTEGQPSSWKIAAMHRSSTRTYDFESLGAVDFLVQLVSNKIAQGRKLFGPYERPVFEPVQRPTLKGLVNPFTGKPYDT